MSLTDWMSKRKSYITSTTTNECYVARVLDDEGTVGKNIDFNYCLIYSIHVFHRCKKWHFLLQKWSSCFLWRKSWFLSIQNLGLWCFSFLFYSPIFLGFLTGCSINLFYGRLQEIVMIDGAITFWHACNIYPLGRQYHSKHKSAS